MTQDAPAYSFPHTNTGESRRLDLFAERLDPLTKRRIGQLGIGPAVRCLEIGAWPNLTSSAAASRTSAPGGGSHSMKK